MMPRGGLAKNFVLFRELVFLLPRDVGDRVSGRRANCANSVSVLCVGAHQGAHILFVRILVV